MWRASFRQRIECAVHAQAGRPGDGDQHGLAPGPAQGGMWCLPHYLAAEAVGEDQARVWRQDAVGEVRGDREQQPVAIGAVLRPFVVGTVILEAGFDLRLCQFCIEKEPWLG